MIWAAVYASLVAMLFVRVRTDEPLVPDPPRPVVGEPLWLVSLHHGLFYLLLLSSPLEAAMAGGRAQARPAGALLFGAGVVGYRLAGRALGDALSPLIEPRPGAPLVTRGLYRHVRHPMYLAQALVAVGAPLTLGCRYALGLTVAALVVLLARMLVEEEALARTFPDYPHYAARTKRIVPFLF